MRRVVRRGAVCLGVVCLLAVSSAGCGLFSRAPAKASAPPEAAARPVPSPAPPPPAPKRGPDGRIADEEMLRQLVQGKTTKEQVRATFGIPQEVVFSPGVESFIYYRDKTSGWFTRTADRVEMLTIRFDDKGLLKDFEYRYSGK